MTLLSTSAAAGLGSRLPGKACWPPGRRWSRSNSKCCWPPCRPMSTCGWRRKWWRCGNRNVRLITAGTARRARPVRRGRDRPAPTWPLPRRGLPASRVGAGRGRGRPDGRARELTRPRPAPIRASWPRCRRLPALPRTLEEAQAVARKTHPADPAGAASGHRGRTAGRRWPRPRRKPTIGAGSRCAPTTRACDIAEHLGLTMNQTLYAGGRLSAL